MGTIIESREVSFSYKDTEKLSLNSVSLTVAAGECVVLCGKSGSGKTTFSRLLNGICPSFFQGEMSGVCICRGLESGKDGIEAYVNYVGSVFQNPKTQYFNTNSTAELAFPCENTGVLSEEIRERVSECAQRFQIEKLMDRSLFHMSGGEKQRIAFAAANMLHPEILVLDEPTSNLDYAAIERLHDMILKMKQQGITIVLAEHRLAWLRDIADKYCYFDNGTLKEKWSAVQFAQIPQSELNELGLRATDLRLLREATEAKRQGPDQITDALLSTRDLTIGYDKEKPICRIKEFALKNGEIVGLMGHNGIGKSTLAKTLCGLQKPISGEILWNGRKLRGKELTRHAFLVMQDVNYQLFADSVREEVLLGAMEADQCDEVLALLGLNDLADLHPMSLSGGQKQRVAIASAMVSGKELIVLDEPTSGLDYYHMMQVGTLLSQLKARGKCVLVITHDEELTAKWCDRIITLENESDGKENRWNL